MSRFSRRSAKPLVISSRVHFLNVRGCHRDKLTRVPRCDGDAWQPVQVVIVTLSAGLSSCVGSSIGFSELWSEINFETEVIRLPDPPPRRPPRRSWARSLECPPSVMVRRHVIYALLQPLIAPPARIWKIPNSSTAGKQWGWELPWLFWSRIILAY